MHLPKNGEIDTLPETDLVSTLLLPENNGAVAQLVRVPDCRSGGWGFESPRPRYLKPREFSFREVFLCSDKMQLPSVGPFLL